MKLPKTLKVGGRTYWVVYPFKFTDSATPLVGLHCPNSQTIKLGDTDVCGVKINQEAIIVTLLHELLHAIDHVYCNNRVQQIQNSEEIIDQIAEGFYQVVKDNDLGGLICGK